LPDAIPGQIVNSDLFSRNPFVLTVKSEDGEPLAGTTPETRAALELLRARRLGARREPKRRLRHRIKI